MADGETHYKYLKMGWWIVIPVGIIIFISYWLIGVRNAYLYPIFIYCNYLACAFFDPDNDLLGLTSSEGRILRVTKKFYIGFIGAIIVSYGFLYAYIIGNFGGHRSILSHGVAIGTIGRMIFYNLPFLFIFYLIYGYGLVHWEWTTKINIYDSFAMKEWLPAYLSSQFMAWFIGDGIHLILDTEWAKGRLYTPKKFGKE